jgi:hypothetical protein
MSDEEKIVELPVKFKNPVEAGRYLKEVSYPGKCWHEKGPFIVDTTLATVECGMCKEKLNPMWVLDFLARKETHWHSMRARYAEEMARLAARSKTKCQHCHKITRISHA